MDCRQRMGENVEWATGAKRASIKPRYDLVPLRPLVRLTETYGEGNLKYGRDNWKKGMPFSDILNHVIEHLMRWKEDGGICPLEKEDHLAHAAWGVFALMYFEETEEGQEHNDLRMDRQSQIKIDL